MRLTPADVHNVAFKKPSIGKRGYDEDEVDAFLDIVEEELTRLIEENNDLRQQLAAFESGQGSPLGAEDVPEYAERAPAQQAPEQEASDTGPLYTHAEAPPAEGVDDAATGTFAQAAGAQPIDQAQQPAAPTAPAQAEPPAVQAAPMVAAGPADHHLQAARLLGLAQETAERLTSEANAEAESVKFNARAESEKMLSDARNESERMLTEAKNNSESMMAEASAKAESTIRDSQIKAEAMDREAQRKYSEVMNQLTAQRTSLENKIDGLRTYEREYRSRLKNWISDQLHQLDATDRDDVSGPPGDADQPVPAGEVASD